jgi:hypothetical protein
MTDIAALVNDAKAKGTFSVLDAARGNRSYPQDIKTVYTDVAAAYEVKRLEKLDKGEKDREVHESIVAQIEDAKERVRKSALTFRLRGIGEGTKDSIRDEALAKFPEVQDQFGNRTSGGPDYGEGAVWNNDKTLAEHIIDVTDADGYVDEHHWTPEEIAELRETLPPESFGSIVELMFELSFAAAYFDASVTPDFS